MTRYLTACCLCFLTTLATAQEGCPPAKSASLAGGTVTVLFDGETLDGWRGREDLWTAEDGQIVGRSTDENPIQGNTFLIGNEKVEGDFELTLQYRIESGNSGIQYHSRVVDEEQFVVSGYQADIDATGKFTGILYEEKARGILATRGQSVAILADGEKMTESFGKPEEIAMGIHDDQWNDYRILVRGHQVEHYINEAMTVRVLDAEIGKSSACGVIALQLHRGPAMTVRFKNVSLRVWE